MGQPGIDLLSRLLNDSENIVAFTGAGISTDSLGYLILGDQRASGIQ